MTIIINSINRWLIHKMGFVSLPYEFHIREAEKAFYSSPTIILITMISWIYTSLLDKAKSFNKQCSNWVSFFPSKIISYFPFNKVWFSFFVVNIVIMISFPNFFPILWKLPQSIQSFLVFSSPFSSIYTYTLFVLINPFFTPLTVSFFIFFVVFFTIFLIVVHRNYINTGNLPMSTCFNVMEKSIGIINPRWVTSNNRH